MASVRNTRSGENVWLRTLHWRVLLVLTRHCLNISHTILFWVPFYSNYYIFGVFLFIPWCGFFGPEIMQDSESPVLRLSGRLLSTFLTKILQTKSTKSAIDATSQIPVVTPFNANVKMK